MKGIEHRKVSVNGISMHVAEKGEGPTVLLIHGFPELWYSWRHQIHALAAQGYRAVAPDMRGYGETDAPASPASYTIFHVVGDLIALLDVLAQDQKHEGGAGIKDLKLMNHALLGKWLWRLGNEDGVLWNNLIKAKYGRSDGGWWTNTTCNSRMSVIWRDVLSTKPDFLQGISIVSGRGNRTRFWQDPWAGLPKLSTSFPNIFRIAKYPSCTVADCLSSEGGNPIWNIECRRDLTDMEIDEYATLLRCIYSAIPNPNMPDRLVWHLEKQGSFSVKSFYGFLSANLPRPPDIQRYHGWYYSVPPKIAAFGWVVGKQKVLTVDNLRKRGMYLTNICVCCMANEETVNHLFIHCPFIHNIWSIFLLRFNVTCCFPSSTASLLSLWHGINCGKHRTPLWRMALLAVWWAVWTERNDRCFNNNANSADRVALRAILSLVDWASYSSKTFDCNFDFLVG